MKSANNFVIASGWMRRIVSASASLALTATILFMICAAAATAARAQTAAPAKTFSTLYSFTGDPAGPEGPLVQGTDGNLYGTTAEGGTTGNGTIFKITTGGTLTTIYSFCPENQCSGGVASSALIQAANGNFYGAASIDAGVVFEVTPSANLTTVYSFCSQANCADGYIPNGPLLQGMDGNFYGTTDAGGAGGVDGAGTIFKLTPSGTLTTLYNFCSQANCSDGSQPLAGVIEDPSGNLYGTTYNGGLGGGTVYKLSPSGALTTLYTFCSLSNCGDGEYPSALTLGSDGNLYGTTERRGSSDQGTVFRLSLNGTLTTLHTFCTGSCSDGLFPGLRGESL